MADRNVKLSVVFEAVDKADSKLKGIRKEALNAGRALTQARSELKSLERVQGDVSSFRKLKKGLGESNQKLAEAQARVSRLAAEMKRAGAPTRELERQFARAKKEATGLSEKTDRDAQSLQRLRDRLKEAGVNTRDLASAQKDLKKRLADATKGVEDQKGAYAELMKNGGKRRAEMEEKGSKGPGSTTDKAVSAGLIIGTLREARDLVAAPIVADANAQEQMTQIGIKANLSREQLEKMRIEISQLAPQVRMTNDDLRGGVDFLAASGLDPRAALQMMKPIAKASHAYKAEVSDLAQATNAALSNLKIPLGPNDIDRTKQTARVLDIMAVAGNKGNFEIKDMARSFPTLTARLAALGQEGVPATAELASALQVAWKSTGNADEAANNIDNLLMKINAKETIQNFKKFGVDLPAAMRKAYAEGKGPLEAIADLTQKATHGDMTKLSYLFGDQQAQTGVLSMIQNLKEYRQIRDETLSSASVGQIDRDFATRAQDVSSRWDLLGARWSSMKESFGAGLRDATNAVMSGVDWLITPTAMNNAHKQAVKVGNDVGDGMALGLQQRQPKVRAAAAALANSMPQETRKNLEVHSPSRVFMEIGRHTADGLALGIRQHSKGPAHAVRRMASGVAAAGAISLTPMAAAARPAQGAAGGAGAAPITIHINAAPGMNVQELAREVGRELQRAQAQQGRSRYEDR